jgi:hypothetical protein
MTILPAFSPPRYGKRQNPTRHGSISHTKLASGITELRKIRRNSRPYSRLGSNRFQRGNRRPDEAVPREKGPLAGDRQPHVRRLVEIDDPLGNPLVAALH